MTWVPESCTLPTVEQPLRAAEFDDLFATAVRAAERADRTSLLVHLPAGGETVAIVRDLVAREARCCSFFSFEVRPSSAGTVLRVHVPESQTAVLDAMAQRVESARTGIARS